MIHVDARDAPCGYATQPQPNAAVYFLASHPGKIASVTIDIGRTTPSCG
jgi:hypothetical protein